jgi:hypothetical protein
LTYGILVESVDRSTQKSGDITMREFTNGWPGLWEYAIRTGVATADDTEDVVANKIKWVLQGTLPEKEPVPELIEEPEVFAEIDLEDIDPEDDG